jgi:hypothetical protein
MSIEEMESMVSSYRLSGLSQRLFCDREGIKFSTFTYWLKRVKDRGSDRSGFTEVVSAKTACDGIEVVFPNGVMVRGIRDLAILDHLLGR